MPAQQRIRELLQALKSESSRHHWSGWPGAYCLDCGSEDPMEIAITDNVYDPIANKWATAQDYLSVLEKSVCQASQLSEIPIVRAYN